MCKRNFRKLTSLLLVMYLLLTLFPSGVIAASEAGTQTDTFQLDADCRILNYVHESVFNQADHVERPC